MRNTDRHHNNFALIRDVETLRIWPASLFDTGMPLWAGQIRIDNDDYKTRPFFNTYKSPTAVRQLHLIYNWDRYDLNVLHDWSEEVAHRLSSYGLISEARIRQISQALDERIEKAQGVRDSSSKLSHGE